MMDETLLVLTSLPDSASADRIVRVLMESRLAGRITRLAPAQTLVRRDGKVEVALEIPLMITIRSGCYLRVEEAIRMHHPDPLPEIIALDIRRGLPAYLQQLIAQTGDEGSTYA